METVLFFLIAAIMGGSVGYEVKSREPMDCSDSYADGFADGSDVCVKQLEEAPPVAGPKTPKKGKPARRCVKWEYRK